jgi:hypothetical protein
MPDDNTLGENVSSPELHNTCTVIKVFGFEFFVIFKNSCFLTMFGQNHV